MIIVISESDKTVALMNRGFMNTAHSPLTRPFKATTDTLTARNRDRTVSKTVTSTKDNSPFSGLSSFLRIPALKGTIAGHRPTILEPDTTTERSSSINCVFRIYVRGRFSEHLTSLLFRQFNTFLHGSNSTCMCVGSRTTSN